MAFWLVLRVVVVVSGLLAQHLVDAVVPSAEIQLKKAPNQQLLRSPSLLAAPSADVAWGGRIASRNDAPWLQLAFLNPQHAQACNAFDASAISVLPGQAPRVVSSADLAQSVVVADRGNCSFLQKAHNAQNAGAKALIIRETKEDIYRAIQTHRSEGSKANESAEELPDGSFKPKFDFDCANGQSFVQVLADPVWQTDDPACFSNASCGSNACVLTGETRASDGRHELCCMWDTFVVMGANYSAAKDVVIPVVFVTMSEGKQLETALRTYTSLWIRIFERPLPPVDLSSLLLWLVGVATACGGAFYSALPNRERLLEDEERAKDHPKSRHHQQQQQQDLTWNVDAAHAIGFILCAGGFLTLFYFVKLNGIIPIIFGLASVGALTQIVFTPLVLQVFPDAKKRLVWHWLELEVLVAELIGMVLSSVIVMVWYLHRRDYWLLQDVLGVLLCCLFLRVVQIPSLRVASILLSLAFVYDVFFVFISPFVFGSSVMEDVATGGPAARTRHDYPGIDFCERYPTYATCLDPAPMPMLLVMPRLLDWIGGTSMLGLGDIILPGLLLSFALRFDYSRARDAKRKSKANLAQLHGTTYYPRLCVSYAVGLGMANVAVSVTQMGQPALMYLVPCTLGTLYFVGWRRGELDLLLQGFEQQDDDNDDDESCPAPVSPHSQIRSCHSARDHDTTTAAHSDAMPLLSQR